MPKGILFLLSIAVVSSGVAADPPRLLRSCAQSFGERWASGLDSAAGGAGTLARWLPAKARAPIFGLVDRTVGRARADWRMHFNERVIARHFRRTLRAERTPTTEMEREVLFQAQQFLIAHAPDLVPHRRARLVLLREHPLYLFVGRESTPRRIPPRALLLMKKHELIGWFEDTGRLDFTTWRPILPRVQ